MITVRLPWPPKELSPNARVHWARKAGVSQKYRQDACVLTLKLVVMHALLLRVAPGLLVLAAPIVESFAHNLPSFVSWY